MRVIGYVRVSSQEQAEGGQSLDVQREKIALYCKLHGLDLVETIEDAGFSAKNLRRPGVERALAMLRDGEAEGLLIPKLDRLSRSVRDWSHLIEQVFSEKGGRSLLSIEDSIDTRTAGGRLVLFVLSAVSQWERETIGERTKAVLDSKRAKGEPTNHPPEGLRIVREGDDGRDRATRFEPDPESDGLKIAARARALREKGRTYRAIAERLAAEGLNPPRARSWSPQAVKNLCTNPRLADYVAA